MSKKVSLLKLLHKMV